MNIDDHRQITLRFLAEPSEVNFGGNVHGGTVMKWIDQAAYTCAARWSGKYCVTVYVGGIRFLHPIHIGHLVEVQAQIIYTGRSSMHISVDVLAGDPKQPGLKRTTHCIIVFVAVDPDGKPVKVPKWQPQSTVDQMLEAHALKLIALRNDIEEEMSRYPGG